MPVTFFAGEREIGHGQEWKRRVTNRRKSPIGLPSHVVVLHMPLSHARKTSSVNARRLSRRNPMSSSSSEVLERINHTHSVTQHTHLNPKSEEKSLPISRPGTASSHDPADPVNARPSLGAAAAAAASQPARPLSQI